MRYERARSRKLPQRVKHHFTPYARSIRSMSANLASNNSINSSTALIRLISLNGKVIRCRIRIVDSAVIVSYPDHCCRIFSTRGVDLSSGEKNSRFTADAAITKNTADADTINNTRPATMNLSKSSLMTIPLSRMLLVSIATLYSMSCPRQ